jgi:hypothetical protein
MPARRERAAANREAGRLREEAESKARQREDEALIPQIRALAQSLASAGVEPERFYGVVIRRRKLFGGWVDVEDPVHSLYGWYAGDYYWPELDSDWDFEFSQRREPRTSWTKIKTYVMADGAIRSSSKAHVRERSVGFNPYRDDPFYGPILQELTKLARANGISV